MSFPVYPFFCNSYYSAILWLKYNRPNNLARICDSTSFIVADLWVFPLLFCSRHCFSKMVKMVSEVLPVKKQRHFPACYLTLCKRQASLCQGYPIDEWVEEQDNADFLVNHIFGKIFLLIASGYHCSTIFQNITFINNQWWDEIKVLLLHLFSIIVTIQQHSTCPQSDR